MGQCIYMLSVVLQGSCQHQIFKFWLIRWELKTTQLETKPAGEQVAGFPGWAGRVLSHHHWDLYLQTTSQDYLDLEIRSRGNSRKKTHSDDTGFNFLWKTFKFFFLIFIFCFSLCSHWSPHVVWASPRSCHEPGLSEQACGAGSTHPPH